MNPILLICTLVSCALLVRMIHTDFRGRYVDLLCLVAFAVSLAVYCLLRSGVWRTIQNIICNVIMLGLLSLSLLLYFGVLRRPRLRFRDYMGIGDVLFVLSLSGFFALKSFVFFLTVSSLGTLLMWMIPTGDRNRECTVPLVAAFGICFIPVMLYDNIKLWIS